MIKNWLNKPFPYLELNFKNVVYLALFFGLFISFILIIVGVILEKNDTIFLRNIAIFGLITFISVFFICFFSPKIFKKFFEPKKWTILKQIIFSLINIFIITILNTLFDYFTNLSEESLIKTLIISVLQTFLIGVIPSIILIFGQNKNFTRNTTELQMSNLTELKTRINYQLITLL